MYRHSCEGDPSCGLGYVAVLCVAAALAMGGCASGRDWRQIGRCEDYPHMAGREGVSVAAEAWVNGSDLRTVLKKGADEDILAVRVIIFNNGDSTVRFSCTQAKLVLPGGQALTTLPVSDICRKLEDNGAAAAMIVHVSTLGYGAMISAAIAHSAEENSYKAQSAARQSSMTLVTVDPGQAMCGFLYFDCPKRLRRSFNGEQPELKLCRIVRSKGEVLDFSISIPVDEKRKG